MRLPLGWREMTVLLQSLDDVLKRGAQVIRDRALGDAQSLCDGCRGLAPQSEY